jgi:hypothetical protein
VSLNLGLRRLADFNAQVTIGRIPRGSEMARQIDIYPQGRQVARINAEVQRRRLNMRVA